MKREIINCDCCGSEIPNSPEAYRGEFKYSLPFHSRGETTIEQGELSDICMKCTNKIKAFIENISAHEQSRQAAVMQSPPLGGLPENKPIYKDSGLWQMRSDDMEDLIIQQGVNESDDSFLSRCKEVHTEEMRRLLSNDGGGAA